MTIDEICEKYNISRGNVYKLLKDKTLKSIRLKRTDGGHGSLYDIYVIDQEGFAGYIDYMHNYKNSKRFRSLNKLKDDFNLHGYFARWIRTQDFPIIRMKVSSYYKEFIDKELFEKWFTPEKKKELYNFDDYQAVYKRPKVIKKRNKVTVKKWNPFNIISDEKFSANWTDIRAYLIFIHNDTLKNKHRKDKYFYPDEYLEGVSL